MKSSLSHRHFALHRSSKGSHSKHEFRGAYLKNEPLTTDRVVNYVTGKQ